jgi:hypothetical protein
MKIIAFLTDYDLKLTFLADKPPPSNVAFQEYLMAAETDGDYFS